MDVCYLITKSFDAGHKVVLKATIINMGFKLSYPIGVDCKLKLKKDDFKNWDICSDSYAACLRYAEWRSL